MLVTRTRVAAIGAIACGAIGYAWFATRPEMAVLVGLQQRELGVPAHYQASVFPALGALSAVIAWDAWRGDAPWFGRALLVIVTTALAVLRLLALVPTSGHALFAAALVAHELRSRDAAKTPFALGLAAIGLGVSAWYKLVVWADRGWFAASIVLGVAIGWVVAHEKISRSGSVRRDDPKAHERRRGMERD